MNTEYVAFGETLPNLDDGQLSLDVTRQMLTACRQSQDFEPVELRIIRREGHLTEIVIVDCVNDQVPSHNPFGIRNRERLALAFHDNPRSLPDVRVLRADFPATSHQNIVCRGEPVSLCLYSAPWSAVERSWTPQNHLRHIVWWLKSAATGTLHQIDQPLEPLFLDSPFDLVLPPDFSEKIGDGSYSFVLRSVTDSMGQIKVVRGAFRTTGNAQHLAKGHHLPVVLSLPAVVHGDISRPPLSLGELHDQLAARGAPIMERLCDEISRGTPQSGLSQGFFTLLLTYVPVLREYGKASERPDVRAFLVECDFAELGQAVGALYCLEQKYYAVATIGGAPIVSADWRSISIMPLNVTFSLTKDSARQASGVPKETADFRGALAGVGALGSALADVWSREAWGNWTLLDHDHIKPHNLVRHIAKDGYVGRLKVDVVQEIIKLNYHQGYAKVKCLAEQATDWDNEKVKGAIESAEFVVDATTTLEVPRDLAQNENVQRAASVFLTPSGLDAVLLLEDVQRKVRLDSLEAQYYRAIIESSWGKDHLNGHVGHLWVGAGCRDISAVISNEQIQLFAGLLSRQLRGARDRPEATIRVWHGNAETGAIEAHPMEVKQTITSDCGRWNVTWDTGLKEKLHLLRAARLPSETGGVLLGYIDQKLKTIFIVDALAAPADSEADTTGFARGTLGLKEQLKDVALRTANVIGYIGEWHSHPSHCSVWPSGPDGELLAYLTSMLTLDGQPALMLIVGEQNICLSLAGLT